MKEIDLSVLVKCKELTSKAKLSINILAPLSMVSSLPGSYFRSLKKPTKFMICGMLENILGWHFSETDRKKIRKLIKKKQKSNQDFRLEEAESGYLPIIDHLIKIETEIIPHLAHYDDTWTQHLKDRDERHMKGTRNYDWQLEKRIDQLEDNSKSRNNFFKKFQNKFPKYYYSPKTREFVFPTSSVSINATFSYRISSNKKLIELLSSTIKNKCSTAYLGTSEGWVEIEIEEI